MRETKSSRWSSVILLSCAFSVMLIFTNCSSAELEHFFNSTPKRTEINEYQGKPAEVIETSGIDGRSITEESLFDLELELEVRRINHETEFVYTEASKCGPNQVLVCHVPSGDPMQRHDICTGISTLQAHVHGPEEEYDYVGSCQDVLKLGQVNSLEN